ncbi:MAG TPA: aminotransferase class V-fold PLP-dependent enzyme [Thermomicrobiales bacterium]|nr:aminotransferase class V-fold PLP-dependent enzyme [Thermomicrobiales bacterium]
MTAAHTLDGRITALRADTPGCAHVAHFNHAGSSLSPQPVLDAVIDHLTLEASIGGYEAAAAASDRLDAAYTSIARLLNASPDEIALVENATRGWDMAVYAIPFAPGDRVLTTQSEYASNLVALLQIARHRGVEVEVIPNDRHGQVSLDALREALTHPVAAVFIAHMPTNSGLIQPAGEIGALIRELQPSAWFVLDACQTAGQVPLDVEQLGCDILSATSRKYLRGPRGAGFVYVRRSRIGTMEPPLLDLHAADLVSPTEFVIRSDARRFENWESYVAGRLGLGAAVDYALALGLDAIRDRVQRQADLLRSRLGTFEAVTIHDAGETRGGIVTFSHHDVSPERIKEALAVEKINVSLSNIYRTYLDPGQDAIGTYIRASVHYLTTDQEIDRLAGVIETLDP